MEVYLKFPMNENSDFLIEKLLIQKKLLDQEVTVHFIAWSDKTF